MKNILPRYPFAFLTIFLILGILTEQYFHFSANLLIGLFCVFICLAAIFRNRLGLIYLFAVLLIVTGAIRYSIWNETQLEHPLTSYFPIQEVNLSVKVVDPPVEGKRYFLVNVDKLFASGQTTKINRKFLFKSKKPIYDLKPGDHIFLKNVTLEDLPQPRNPGQFDYGRYLKFQGVMGSISVLPHSAMLLHSEQPKFSLERKLFEIRKSLVFRIKRILPETSANFLAAILLGERQGIDRDIKADFQNSGVAHVLAISGLHVGFVVLFIYILISFLPLSFRWHHIFTVILLLGYMLLTGANPPVVRASLMVTIYLLGKNLEKKPNVYNTVFTAAFLILLFQPQQLFWVGFQFSFVAVLSILFLYALLQPLEEKLLTFLPKGKLNKLIHRAIITPFLVSLAAQLGTIPLIAIYFHKIPLVSFVLNLIVIPLVGVIVPIGFLAILTSFLLFSIGLLISELLSHIIEFLIAIVHFAANIPMAYIQIPKVPGLAVVLYLLILILIFSWNKPKLDGVRKPAWVFVGILLIWFIAPKSHANDILMLDVGQGESSLVRTTGDQILLFDAGPTYPNWDTGENVIFPALQEWGELHVHKVIISHPHNDHMGGMFSLLKLISIDSVYLPPLKSSYFLQDSLLNELKHHQIPCRFLKAGDMIYVDKQTRIYVLAPFETYLHTTSSSGMEVNNTSIVCLMKTAGSSMLFTGDAEYQVEHKVQSWGKILDTDILKIGHHGSPTSSSKEFLNATSPEIGLIPVGKNNRYNHPSPLILFRLKSLGVRYFRTDLDGALWLREQHGRLIQVDWQ